MYERTVWYSPTLRRAKRTSESVRADNEIGLPTLKKTKPLIGSSDNSEKPRGHERMPNLPPCLPKWMAPATDRFVGGALKITPGSSDNTHCGKNLGLQRSRGQEPALKSCIATTSALVVALLAAACNQPEYAKQAAMPPDPGETLPEWAFDAPFYFQPTTEAMPRPVTEANPDYPTHYYVNRRVFPIDRPDNEVHLDRAPRIAVWWTNTNGGAWARSGFLGLGQTHFHFVAGDDGDYGIRFVGPGIRESLTQETVPHRIYHVDTVAPCITVRVAPEQPVYYPEDELVITWTVEDPNLDADSIRLNVCWSWENPDMLELRRPDNEGEPPRDNPPPPATRLWWPYKADCSPNDMATFTIPARAQGEALQFQVRAKDRAGNYGAGYSCPIFVSGITSWAAP